MAQGSKRSGFSLVVAGLAGFAFFALTDHRYGLAARNAGTDNPIDLANQGLPGTVIGIVGSLLVFGIGVWLLTRKTV